MKVSFVVPIYKKSKDQVIAALDSLKEQSHKDIEVICVFDGKDDDLEKSVQEFVAKDTRFSIYVIEHGGAPKARNYGFTKSTGEVVSFWDADCYAAPEMTKVWVMTFDKYQDIDFCYSGYKWTDHTVPGFYSEPFDPWILKQYNYIASMFPIKREKFPGWDESLEGLQDWDYWRRAVDAGCKGRLIPGFGFATDLPDESSISGNKLNTSKRVKRIREKLNDEPKDILVVGSSRSTYKNESIHIAKVLNSDYLVNWHFYKVSEYKLILVVGFDIDDLQNLIELFQSTPNEKKAIYWIGHDSESAYCGPYFQVKHLIKKIGEVVKFNFCEGERTRKILNDMEIKAEVLPFPAHEGVPLGALPEKFKVLAKADESFKEHLDSIVKALPFIDFTVVSDAVEAYDISNYTVGIQFTRNPRLEVGPKTMLMNGRYIISNIQEPFTGFVDTDNFVKFKTDVVEKLIELEGTKEINKEAQDYYLETTDRSRFAKLIKETIALEAVA